MTFDDDDSTINIVLVIIIIIISRVETEILYVLDRFMQRTEWGDRRSGPCIKNVT